MAYNPYTTGMSSPTALPLRVHPGSMVVSQMLKGGKVDFLKNSRTGDGVEKDPKGCLVSPHTPSIWHPQKGT